MPDAAILSGKLTAQHNRLQSNELYEPNFLPSPFSSENIVLRNCNHQIFFKQNTTHPEFRACIILATEKRKKIQAEFFKNIKRHLSMYVASKV